MTDSWDERDPTPAAGLPAALPSPGTTVPGSRVAAERRCGRCGATLPRTFHFCGTCGFNLEGAAGGLAYRDPLIGVVVGDRYRLLSRIGVGGMGTVYKAEHTRMGKVVAVKLLHGDLSRDMSMIRRFTREARAASRLSSPHTVSVFDYGQSEGLVYLVMEYLQGSDLGHILRAHGPLAPATAERVVTQVAASLEEAHAHGIIHRDLKPENIFVCAHEGDGEPELVKVLDFGLAKLRATREDSMVSTAHGANLVGTPYYMSPEQISGREVDLRSDVYSLGAVVFKLLTDRAPYEHDNPVAVLSRHLTAPVPAPSDHLPELARLDAPVRKALAKAPGERYATVTEFASDFARAVAGSGNGRRTAPSLEVPAASSEDVTTRADFDRFRRGLYVRSVLAVVFALAVVAGGAGLFWWGVVEGNFARSDFESEPNDLPQQATPLPLDAQIQGYIGLPALGRRADEDYFVIRNDTGHPVVLGVSVSGVPNLDLVLRAFDDQLQVPVVSNSGGEAAPESIPNLYVNGRFAYVHVREYWVRDRPASHNTAVAYTLSTWGRPPEPLGEVEPNEELSRAVQLMLNAPVTGFVGWAGDLDLYRAPELPAEGRIVTVEVSGEARVDLELRFLDLYGRELFRRNAAGPSEPERAVFFATAAGHGALYVGVAAADSPARDVERPYRLIVSYEEVQPLRPPSSLD